MTKIEIYDEAFNVEEVPLDEEQKYIKKYCLLCKKERVFVTSISPPGDVICTQCRHRESIIPFKMVMTPTGCKMIKEKQ